MRKTDSTEDRTVYTVRRFKASGAMTGMCNANLSERSTAERKNSVNYA